MRHSVSAWRIIFLSTGDFIQRTVGVFQETQSVSFQDACVAVHYFKTAKPSFQARSAFQAKPELRKPSERQITMTNNIIADLSMDFSISIVNLCDNIKGKSAITNQLLRSGTSIGANIHEANYASSRADFIAKMQIALKECYETEYWLELFVKTAIITEEQYNSLKNSCSKIRKLLIASVNTAKANS